MRTNLEKNMHQIIKERSGCSLKAIVNTADSNRIRALGIYGKSEFFCNEPGYTVVTLLTKPQVIQKEIDYELTGSQGFLIKVPDDIEKPFKMRILPESPVVLTGKARVFPVFEENLRYT